MLHYNYFRDYDPQTGRYIESDPIGLDGDINTYTYTGNDPISSGDPTGTFLAPWHFGITLIAALRTGHGVGKSIGYAWQAVRAAFGGTTQGVNAADTAQHGMAGYDEKLGRWQIPVEAMRSNSDLVARDVASGDLGHAAHGVQDPFAAGHGFQEWHGFGHMTLSAILKHLYEDAFPSASRVDDAYDATVDMFQKADSPSTSDDSSSSGQNSGSSHGNHSGRAGETIWTAPPGVFPTDGSTDCGATMDDRCSSKPIK